MARKSYMDLFKKYNFTLFEFLIQSMITLNKQYPLHLTLITTLVNII